jgi:hypothetical protein
MRFQSTTWIAEFICNAIDQGAEVILMSTEHHLAKKVADDVSSMFYQQRRVTPRVDPLHLSKYSGSFITASDNHGITVQIAFGDGGFINELSVGGTAIFYGNEQTRLVQQDVYSEIECGRPDNAYNLLTRRN